MITFEPDAPWGVDQIVEFRYPDGRVERKRITSVEHSDDGMETQYAYQAADIGPERDQ